MQTILLTAKHYAITSNASEITTEHFLAALQQVNISDTKIVKVIYETFRDDFVHASTLSYDSTPIDRIELDLAQKHESIVFSQELDERLDTLEKSGISLKGKYSTLITSVENIEEIQDEFQTQFEQLEQLIDSLSDEENKKDNDSSLEGAFREIHKFINNDSTEEDIKIDIHQHLQDIKQLKSTLNQKLLNQESAVESVCDALVKSLYLTDKKKPMGIFFFVGPPATGKTYLAQLLTEHLHEYNAYKVFDMTQFNMEETGGDLFGTGRMWGNPRTGALTSFVRENPKSILVFDEFEKAHTRVQANFLSMLSEGYADDLCGWCKDGQPWTQRRREESKCREIEERIDFTKTIVIFTSNLGTELYSNKEFLSYAKNTPKLAESMIIETISNETKVQDQKDTKAILPEMLSRLKQGSIVLFNSLDYTSLLTILKNSVLEDYRLFKKIADTEFIIKDEEEIITITLLSYGPDFDVRKIKSTASSKFFDFITDHVMQNDIPFPEKMDIVLSKSAKSSLNNILDELRSDGDILQAMYRKNLHLNFSLSYSGSQDHSEISIDSIDLEQIKRSKDFGGEHGIRMEVPDISFDDIAGHTYVKERLTEIIKLLKSKKTLNELGVDLPKGMLLFGVPGTGKTMLAKAFAKEANLPFIATNGTALLDIKTMKSIFAKARSYAPAILFIDEIDVFTQRGKTPSPIDLLINTLLPEIDGFSGKSNDIFIIAATNRKEMIDKALLRSERIDLHIEVPRLDKEARRYFINKMLKNKRFVKSIDIETLLTYTTGLSGADLAKIERESIFYILRHDIAKVDEQILIEQINILKYGERLDKEHIKDKLAETAYHEAGHAIISKLLCPSKTIEQVTVAPRDKTLGFVSYALEEQDNLSKVDIQNQICIALAGRIAQHKKFDEDGLDSGAQNDLEQAIRYALYGISSLGMSTSLENINSSVLKDITGENIFKAELKVELKQWIDQATKKTTELVDKHWQTIDDLAQALLIEETIHGHEIKLV